MNPMQEASSNNNGVFDLSPTNQRTNLYEMFDIIDNWQEDKTHVHCGATIMFALTIGE